MKNRSAVLMALMLVLLLEVPVVSADFTASGELGTGSTGAIVGINAQVQGNIDDGKGGYRINHTWYNFDFKTPVTAWMWADNYAAASGVYYGIIPPKYSDGTPYTSKAITVDLYIENVSIGSGTFSYYVTTGGPLIVSLNYNDDFIYNTSAYDGVKLIEMRDNSNPRWYIDGLHNLSSREDGYSLKDTSVVTWLESTPGHTLFGYKYANKYYSPRIPSNIAYPNQYMWNYYRSTFRNTYNLTSSVTDGIWVEIGKTVDGVTYPSMFNFYNSTNQYLFFSEGEVTENDVALNFFTGADFKIALKDFSGVWWNKTVSIPAGDIDYTPTEYTVQVVPSVVGTGQTFSVVAGTEDPNWDNVDAYTFTILNYGDPVVAGNLPVWIKKSDDHWYQYDGAAYSIDYGTSFPSTVTTTIDVPGTYTIEAAFWETTGGGGKAYDNFTVAGQGVILPITFRTKDYSSGATIAPSTISVRNLGNTTWFNETTSTGTYVFYAILGQYYQWAASADGYEDSEALSNKFTQARSVDITLRKLITVDVGNNTCWVSVYDDDLNILTGAKVLLSDGQFKTTGSSGVVTFTVLEGGTYTITVSKSGYVSQTRTVTVIASSNGFSFELSPNYATVTTTLPGGQTTVDDRTNEEKEQDLVDMVLDSSGGIVGLAILCVIVGLIKLLGK